jgi:uncharacterized protein YebE (UPF0316 family)
MGSKLITVVSITLALVFIVSISLVFTAINRSAGDVNGELGQQKSIMNDMKLQKFDGTIVHGYEVIDAINNMRETTDGIKMSYTVKTGGYSIQYGYGNVYASGDCASDLTYTSYKTYTDMRADEMYKIVDNASFSATLVKSSTGKIVGVYFVQK